MHPPNRPFLNALIGLASLGVPALVASAPVHSQDAADKSDRAPDRAAPQRPTGLIAQWKMSGRQTGLTRDQFLLELANHHRRRDAGVEAIGFLTESALVRAEAEAADAMPQTRTVRAALAQLEAQLKAAGRVLEQEPAFRNMSRGELEDYLAIGLAQQEMTRRAAGLAEGEQPDPDLVSLWMKEARARHKIVTDQERLPPGVVAKVDDREIGLLDLGRVLSRTQPIEEQRAFAQQVVLRQLLADETRKAGISITDADLDRALIARRAAVEANPAAQGIPYEELLRSVGHTEATLREDPAFLANLQRQLLVEQLHPVATLKQQIADDPDGIRAQHGARRHLAVLFLRASEEDNPLVPRDFADSTEVAEKLREAILEGSAPLPELALRFSEHLPSKRNRGDAGWVHRASKSLPEEVLAAAWQLAIHELSEPIRSDAGVWLVRALEVEPPASEEVLIDRMRFGSWNVGVHPKDLLDTAKVDLPAVVAPPRLPAHPVALPAPLAPRMPHHPTDCESLPWRESPDGARADCRRRPGICRGSGSSRPEAGEPVQEQNGDEEVPPARHPLRHPRPGRRVVAPGRSPWACGRQVFGWAPLRLSSCPPGCRWQAGGGSRERLARGRSPCNPSLPEPAPSDARPAKMPHVGPGRQRQGVRSVQQGVEGRRSSLPNAPEALLPRRIEQVLELGDSSRAASGSCPWTTRHCGADGGRAPHARPARTVGLG